MKNFSKHNLVAKDVFSSHGSFTNQNLGLNTSLNRHFSCLLVFLLLGLAFFPVYGLEKEIKLTGETSRPWQDLITWEGLQTEQGKWGLSDILLKDKEYTCTEDTELLLHFNTNPPKEEAGHYTLTPANIVLSKNEKVMGTAAYAFQSDRNVLRFTPRASSLFKKGWQDFSIEFWLYSVNLTDFEVLLYWSAHTLLEKSNQQQYFKCQIQDRKLVWDFFNFFNTDKSAHFTLSGLNNLMPRTWTHHLLRFDSDQGLLEYLVNGEVEGILYVTATGQESSMIYRPKTDGNGSLEIGSNFSGLLDELRLSALFVEQPCLKRYQDQAGTCQTRIFDLGYTGSHIKSIDATYNAPGNSALYFYYRLSDRLEDYTLPSYEWQPFLPNTPFANQATGRYLQLKAEFLPDGNYMRSPLLSEIRIVYEPDFPPTPPAYLVAIAGRGEVTLTWQKVIEIDIKGYEIYYGYESGKYFGTDSSQGPSPVLAENPVVDNKTVSFTLTGLTNGKLYYFNVVALDQGMPPHKSPFSKEVSARPSRLARLSK